MARSIKCTLHINNRWGYCFTPVECNSIAEAVRKGHEDAGGFWFRVVANGKTVRTGYCERYR